MNVLVAADGSAYTRHMLAYIAAHDEWLGAGHDYTVVHATRRLEAAVEDDVGPAVTALYYENETAAVFAPIRSFFAMQQLAATFVGMVGPAARTVATMADAGRYDLVMMGSHGHGRLAGLLIGSVAAGVLASCSTPLLLIRAKGS